jgi:tetratricopeptide (TPR) repeat protein
VSDEREKTSAEVPRRIRASEEAPTVSTPPSERKRAGQLGRGSTLGRYVILEELGEGGMGVVYAAFDPELDRKLAVKLVRSELLQLSGRTRFLREAQAMAKLSHPNVVAVHDVGTLGDKVFLAMELVEGTTLRQWQRAPGRTLRELLGIYVQAGRGLAAAHGAGIVHRDFKPDNVLVGTDGRARVVDFGLARAAGAPEELERALHPSSSGALGLTVTQTGAMLGTPAYMPIEQMRGDATDARTDQFSFCAALWEGVFGARPYDGKSLEELERNLELGRPSEPPAGHRVPKWLRALLHRGLQPKPEDRHANLTALLDEIERVPARTRRRRTAALALVATLAIAGGVAKVQRARSTVCAVTGQELLGVWDVPRRQAVARAFGSTPEAQRAFERTAQALDDYARRWLAVRGDACEATRVRGDQSEALLDLRMECLSQRRIELGAVVDLFSHADQKLIERGARTVEALSELATCSNAAALRAPVRPPSDGTTRARVEELRKRLAEARAQFAAGRYTESMAAVQALASDAAAVHYRPLEAEIFFERGMLHVRLGDYKAAEAAYRDALVAAEESGHDEEAARTAAALVGLLNTDARYDEALGWARMAQAWMTRLGGASGVADVLQIYLGNVYEALGRLDEARAAYEAAIALREKEQGPESPSLGQPLIGLSNVVMEQGQWGKAISVLRRGLAIQEKALGPSHMDVAMTLTSLAFDLMHEDHLDEAQADAERAHAIFERVLGPQHYMTATALAARAAIQLARGKREGLALYRQALTLAERAVGADKPEVAAQRIDFAEALRKWGQPAEAIVQAQQAVAVDEKAVGMTNPILGLPLLIIAKSHLDLGHPARAIAPLERALALRIVDPTLGTQLREALARAKAGAPSR